ncbi:MULTISPECIES: hypothetical protein [Pseudomonas]|jgi:hypothetical protein|uniref:hypothetical protein n=2 Tax=Pseudomonas TaxID=286 RepID=UPI0008765B6E|nr:MULTISPECIES: hypothetical protein [Pseudomonas]MDB6443123.1 hypothetical protein [Pseudomonas sp. 21TX0197]MDT8907408.1 hypothetical protein [Pseudomonas prosekii]NHN70090.1 hypothetical protein [Pseudomonas fluorescens]ROO38182.1 hypothetical protein BIV09_14225 [Pseudomonas sp. 7SR1]SCX54836.1 hypothetical protein SAMN03159507_01658 [Pseudomonas sp. NFACC32-1]
MNRFLHMMFVLKVLVMLSLGSSLAWAECDEHDKQALNGQVTQGAMMIATNDEGTSGDTDDDDSSIDTDEEGDSQT